MHLIDAKPTANSISIYAPWHSDGPAYFIGGKVDDII